MAMVLTYEPDETHETYETVPVHSNDHGCSLESWIQGYLMTKGAVMTIGYGWKISHQCPMILPLYKSYKMPLGRINPRYLTITPL